MLLVLLGSSSAETAIGPVSPTGEVFTKTKKPTNPIENLPYDVTLHQNDEMDSDETDNDLESPIENTAEPKAEMVDWTLVPYVPFKRVDLKPAPDPKIESPAGEGIPRGLPQSK
jgi:hypothetical protein